LQKLEKDILATIRNHPEKRISYDEVLEKLLNPESVSTINHALNKLVQEGFLRQFRATRDGRKQNHYRLIE